MNLETRIEPRPTRLSYYTFALAVMWTIVVVASLSWNIIRERRHELEELATREARAHLNKDLAFRLWATGHGGVYVYVTERTPPNPYLAHVPERDLTTPSGRKLTLMNPAYMVRQLQEDYAELFKTLGHITSLNPLRPENRPDEWERSALTELEKGAGEVFEISYVKGKPHLRLMHPIMTEEGCLKCHGIQGYKKGDIRGGVSVSVPLAAHLVEARREAIQFALSHGVFWILGLGGIALGNRGLKQRIAQHLRADEARYESEERYRLLVGNLPGIVYRGHKDWSVEFFDNKVESLTGYSVIDFHSQRMKWCDVIVEEDLDSAQAYFVQALKAGRSYAREYRLKSKAGDTLWIQDRGQIICDEEGEISYVSGVFFDISARKQLEESLRESERELRLLSSQLLTVQEDERARIARELHDGIGQILSAIKFKIEETRCRIDSGAVEGASMSKEVIVPMLQSAIEEVRRISFELRPSTLDDLGILATIGWFCREFQKVYANMEVERETNIEETEVPETLKIVIFRVLQESMNNAAKHSKADRLLVSLKKEDSALKLMVADNGMGFNLNDALSADSSKRGFGLGSMRERCELSGGSFSVETGNYKGTIVRASWPSEEV